MPFVGCRHRISASAPQITLRLGVDDRLIIKFQLVLLDGAAQLALELVPRAGGQAHFRIEEAISVSASGFGAIQSQVRHFHETIGIGRMLGREGNSDTRGNIHFIAFNIKRPRDHVDNSVCKRRCSLTLVIVPVLNNREFVAAKTRQHVGFPKRRFETRRGFAQQCVPDRVAERVVDVLEAVKIQQKHGKWIAAPAVPCNRLFDLFHNREAIGEARQDVVMRHECNALFGSFPLCNILDNHDEVLRRTLRVTDDDAACGQNARMANGHFNFVVAWIGANHACKRFAVGRIDPLGIPGTIDIEHGFSDDIGPRHLEHRLKRAVHEHKLARHSVLHHDCNGNILDD